ncbi:pyridoxamine 5'-phosphate oxidase family protein [Alterisphingorhabdus coralli]|uniref:Pyridoxamine 5'-phosphate oxidase family protein n=1 Tax=Alterisphingorhabdus coralli TaxID=3071408 RepID=A0AA97F5Y4_9SPHN|nr:pyridoxamine 5'-phosphate oxidase family protein [Parasphingorhabdus sp. SCSIO 66989]WOE74061.1 pyridoxamine 5'-phosphate oxidase family protein [Parasphingorhabdus sp. SCSIO 66989]
MMDYSNTDNLSRIAQDCWHRLNKAASDRRHAFHQLTIANSDAVGQPHQRIMVLREADGDARRLRFHTDARAAKVDMVGDGAPVSVLAYDMPAKIQIRMSGKAHIETDTPNVDKAWEEATLYARRCYLADPAPGSFTDMPISGLPTELEGVEPTVEEAEPGRTNFALLYITIDRMEWLYLAHTGHRRALFDYETDKGWDGRWMVP